MPTYRLTPPAQQDLKEIARYTLEKWGRKQVLSYKDLLEKRFHEIADKTALSRQFSEVYPDVLVNRCEHHYIFFFHPEGKKPSILAILHERMNFVSKLKNRLNT